jgi:hypothetical protein
MQKIPTKLFISHRSEDKPAAQAVANRLRKISNRIEIFLALDPKFEGPRIGKSINKELKGVLGTTSVVLLLFTREDRDWS